MTLVKQDDPKGCGVACVATVCGMSYQLVKDHALETGNWKPSTGMNGGQLRRLLDRLGKQVHSITTGRVPSYPFGGRTAIVKVTATVRCEVWRNGKTEQRLRPWRHWVVWRQGAVWDPGHGAEFPTMAAYLHSAQLLGAPGARTGRWHWL